MMRMRTVQMTLDRRLVEAVDTAVKRLGTTRSAFAREALTAALAKLEADGRERQQRRGYERHPVRRGEFDAWEPEQAWPD